MSGGRKTKRVGINRYFSIMNDKQKMIDESAKMIKELAEDQKVKINLSPEQYRAIEKGLESYDHSKPAQITFIVEGKNEAGLKVAAYTYSGSTCCA